MEDDQYNKLYKVVDELINHDESNSVTYDSYGNIRLRSNVNGVIMDITGGPGFAEDFHKAMKETLKDNIL